MVEGGEGACFAFEAGEAVRVVGDCGRQDFDGDVSIELGVGGAVDDTHAAFAEFGGDSVMGEALSITSLTTGARPSELLGLK